MTLRILLLPPVLALLAACSSMPDVTNYVTPYKIDIRQGNLVSQEMVAQLRPGLTRDQVRFILGSPLVADIFHADRWDYVYRFKPGKGEIQDRRFTVFFVDNKLSRVSGDVIPHDGSPDAVAPQPAAREIVIENPASTADKKEK